MSRHMCLASLPMETRPKAPSGNPLQQQALNNIYAAAFLRNYLWPRGSTLNVGFLDGPDDKRTWVRDTIMRELAPIVNLKFNFIMGDLKDQDYKSLDILVTFKAESTEAWSLIGIQSREYARDGKPSMALGWLDVDSDPTKTAGSGAVVVHEFGHAIGMIHEHQNPCGEKILWDVEQIKREMAGKWNDQMIQSNILDLDESPSLYGSNYDPKSIMHYFFPASWTLNNREGSLNKYLSDTDKKFIKKLYTEDVPQVGAVYVCAENGEAGAVGIADDNDKIGGKDGKKKSMLLRVAMVVGIALVVFAILRARRRRRGIR